MTARNRQKGLSVLGWLITLAGVATVAHVSILLVPHYVDNRTFIVVLESMPQDKVHAMSKAEIREAITRRLKINNIRHLDVRKVMKIERARGATTLAIDYEMREHLIANIDLTVSFEQRFVFGSGGSR